MLQQVKDLVLSLLWLGLLLWLRFDPWPETSMCCGHGQKKRRTKQILELKNLINEMKNELALVIEQTKWKREQANLKIEIEMTQVEELSYKK